MMKRFKIVDADVLYDMDEGFSKKQKKQYKNKKHKDKKFRRLKIKLKRGIE